uniref:xanthine dehydrogenase family protein molybdopterin-binding subunit n=1 Tax=Paraburkholderia tropica TaxID=92647 RepID=UPI002AB12609
MNRADLLARHGRLVIVRQPVQPVVPARGQPGSASTFVPAIAEVFVAVLDDGRILAFNGHVDLGTGIRTSLAQIVAEELDVPAERVEMILGSTAATPNQGPTIASASIQISAVPLRCAAAQARHALLALAAQRLAVPEDSLTTDGGRVSAHGGDASAGLAFGELVRGRQISLDIDLKQKTKDPSAYRLIGRSSRRVDIPAKATGLETFVHDKRVPGMLHGRVIRPPYSGLDCGPFVGTSLISVDESSVADVPGLKAVVVIGDFVGVVAEREDFAIRAARRLKVQWRELPPLTSLDDIGAAISNAPAAPRLLLEEGDVEGVRNSAGTTTLERTYVWPFHMHGSIGPSCAVADYRAAGDGRITIWSGTQNPVSLRYDLARLVGRSEADFDIERMEAAGCYGRNCADDVCGDALLLSRAVGVPVRVQLTRQDEHVWEPKGTGQVVKVTGTVSDDGKLVGYDFVTRYPSNDAPLLALLLCGVEPAGPRVFEMGDRTAVSPYEAPNRRFVCEDLASLVRASWLRGVSALPNSFAHDSFADECAALTHTDPLEFRIRHLNDDHAVELLQAIAQRAGW